MKKVNKIIWIIALIIILVLIGVVVFGLVKQMNYNPENPVATIEVENYGTIKVELYPDVAPQSAANFITLANNGFYDGLTIHRVMKDFIIQGGDKNGDGTGSASISNLRELNEGEEDKEYAIKGEFRSNGVNNKTPMEEGTFAMARSSYSYDSASSQFFIVTKETDESKELYENYAAFGKVIEGMDIVHKIEEIEVTKTETTQENSKPVNAPKITSIKVDTKGIDYGMPETQDVPVDYSSYYQQMGIDPSQLIVE